MQFQKRNFPALTKPTQFKWLWIFLTFLAIGFLTLLSPPEQSLGTRIRIVYLHGAWVWASLVAFLLAGISGCLGLLTHYNSFHRLSNAFGRTGLIFWITYLPLSLLAMQSNGNGLFLSEPRWKLALVFVITGLLLQIDLSLVNRPNLTSLFNLGYIIIVLITLLGTENIIHPSSLILTSESWRIQLFFFSLVLLTSLAVWQIACWWYKSDPSCNR